MMIKCNNLMNARKYNTSAKLQKVIRDQLSALPVHGFREPRAMNWAIYEQARGTLYSNRRYYSRKDQDLC